MNPSPLDSLDLRDIHAAAAPELWPLAPGWWLLAIIVLAALTISSWWLITIWRQRRRKVRILGELDALAERTPAEAATHTSILLRRVALMRFKRIDVASLTGADWLAFLDHSGGNGGFVDGPGKVLATMPYSAAANADVNNDALLSLARQWIETNLGRDK
jgi:hypothetical protein